MSPVVEKPNPRKLSARSIKRDAQRGNKRGSTVAINEITLDEVNIFLSEYVPHNLRNYGETRAGGA
jgi:hypothetical protein